VAGLDAVLVTTDLGQAQVEQRHSDVPPVRLRVLTADAFAAAKLGAWPAASFLLVASTWRSWRIVSLGARLSSCQHRFMETIDEALADLPQPEHDALQRVIDIARRVAPQATDGVSYAVPALKVAGRPLIGVSVGAHHLSIFPFSPAAIDVVRAELHGFSVSKGTIRFTCEHPLPEALIERLVAARLAEIT
jgi:uncharacterized protein YdhG (YjbR/CyaY superfamily)